MQKKIIALAIAAAAAAPAFAADNVTIYGVADAFWASVKTTDIDRYYAINSAGLSGSRIGFKAVEDLGNGTSALAVIEYGFSMDDGNSAVGKDSGLAARQKLVGLTGGWGTAVLGYAQTAGYDFACAATPFAGSALDPIKAVNTSSLYTTNSIILSCNNFGRAGNAFAYISPNFGGFTAAWNHARLTEGYDTTSVANAQKKDASANLLAGTYAAGPVTVNAVYSQISDDDLALGLTAPVKKVKEFGLRGSYNLGVASLFASYQTKDFDVVDDKDKTFTIGAAIPVGAGTIAVDYARANLKEGKLVNSWTGDKKDSFAVAYLHSLSKRTTAYVGLNHLSDKTNASKTVKTDVLAVGLRHTF